jgi:hypothetical protein
LLILIDSIDSLFYKEINVSFLIILSIKIFSSEFLFEYQNILNNIHYLSVNFIMCIFHTIKNLNFIDKHSGLNLQNKHEIICLLSVSIILVQLKQAL